MARSRLRWWLVRLAVAGLVLAGLAAASSLAVRAYAPALSRDRLESALTDALGRPVRIEAVALSLWRGGIEITRLRVEPGAGEGPEPILQVARAGFRVGISSLWRRELVLSTILLQDAILRISGPSRDATPFALDVPDTFALGPITVRLGTLKIERGRATYRDDTRGLVVDIHDLNLTARPVRRGIDFEVRLSGVSLQTSDFRETIADVEGAGWIHQDRLAIRKVAGRWQERRIQATGELRRPFAAAELDLSIEGEADLASLSRRFASPWPLAGVMTAQATVQGPLDAVEVSGRLAIPRLTAGPIQARDVAVRGRWKDGLLDLSQVTAGLFDGTLRGTFATRIARPQETRVAFTLQRASIPALDPLAPTPLGLRGELDAEAEITGDPRRPEEMRGRVLFSGRRIILPGELSRLGPGSVRIAGSFQDAVADVSQATASWPGADVTAGGRVGPEGPLGLRVALRANLETIAPLWGMPVMSGQADAQVEAHGRWASPDVVGQVRIPSLTVSGVRLDAVDIAGRFQNGSLQVNSATATLGQSRAVASGLLTWSDPGGTSSGRVAARLRFSGEGRAPAARWEDFDRWLPPALHGLGRFALAGRAEGTPETWRASGTIEAADLTPQSGIPIRSLLAAFALDSDRLEIARLRAEVDGIPVRGAGTWMWNGTGQASADVGPTDLSRIPRLPDAAQLGGTGRASLQASVRQGTVDVSGAATLDRVTVRAFPLGDGSARFTLRDGQLRADLAFPESRLAATAQGPLDRNGPIAVRVEAKDLALAPTLRRLGLAHESGVEGTLSAVADVTVPIAEPSAARGMVTLDPVRLVVVDEEWANRGPVVLRWEPTGLAIDRLHLAGRLGDLQASGRWDPRGALGLQITGQFPLTMLPLFRPEIREAAGTLAIAGQVGGTAAAPRFTGEATIKNGILQVRDRPETLREVEARMVFSQDAVRLVDATASVGRGRVRASGDLTLQGWQLGAYRFAVTGQNVSIAPTQGVQTTWDLNLELIGRGSKAQLRGEGRLLQGAVSGQFSLVSLLLSRPPETAAESSLAIPLRILLRLDNNLRVNMKLARLRGGGTLSLEGTTAAPVLLGSLETQEGRIIFRNQRWNLLSGAVRFVDPRRTEAILDVTGQARIKEYDVTLRLSGRPDELTVRLSSSPPLSQEEILMLVAMGVTKSQTGTSAGGAMLGEIGRLLVEDLLEATAGTYGPDAIQSVVPDTVEVQRTGQNDRAIRGGKPMTEDDRAIRVGKQLTEDVRVLYSQSLSGAAKRVIRVEYQIFGPLLLSAEQDFQGGVGGDVLLRLRFR